MMNRQDIFMAGLAMILALLAFGAAIYNHDACYRLSKVRWIDERWGRGVARIGYVIMGLFLLALGLLILSGWSLLLG